MTQPIKEADGVHNAWYDEARKMTAEKLPEFIRKLTSDYGHDYGTICHAVAAAAIGAAYAVNNSPVGGITGFQAGCIMWEFITKWQHIEGPARLIQFDDMLYPQYERKFDKTITAATWKRLQEKAAELIEKNSDYTHPAVRAHWVSINRGIVPFGYTIRGED